MRRSVRSGLVSLSLVLVLAMTGCSSKPSRPATGSTQLRVFAAASLTAAFSRLAAQFDSAHPGTTVSLIFAGSQSLATQIRQGAPADVFASADATSMRKVADLLTSPRPFASNRLELIVAPGNPKHLKGLADLARRDLKVVLAAPEVPAGKYARQAVDALHVTVRPVSLEDNVKSVVTKVALGEADAGVVYVTDVAAAKGKVTGVGIPEAQNVPAVYPIAVVTAGKHPAEAQAFVDDVLSTAGRQTLASFGFLPPPSS